MRTSPSYARGGHDRALDQGRDLPEDFPQWMLTGGREVMGNSYPGRKESGPGASRRVL
jgi:hypothetical protein